MSSKCVQWEPSCSMRTDRHDEAHSRFSQFFERAWCKKLAVPKQPYLSFTFFQHWQSPYRVSIFLSSTVRASVYLAHNPGCTVQSVMPRNAVQQETKNYTAPFYYRANTGCENVDCIHLTQCTDYRSAVVHTVMYFRIKFFRLLDYYQA